jgi:hypothetical protein
MTECNESKMSIEQLLGDRSSHYHQHMLKCELYGLRRKWMGKLGFSDMEVKASVKRDPPVSLEEERKQLEAAEGLNHVRES